MAHLTHCQTDAPFWILRRQELFLCNILLPLVPQKIVVEITLHNSQTCLGIHTNKSYEILDILAWNTAACFS